MDSPIMFKTAVGGFDKKAVMSYIFELGETAQATQRGLNDQISELTLAKETADRQLDESARKLQRLQMSLDSVTAELEGEKKRSGQLSEMVDSLNTEVERQRQIIEEKESEANSASSVTGQLQEKYKQLEEKKLEVERASAQIGRLLLDAGADGDRTRAEALEEAERVRREAYEEAQQVIDQSKLDIQESLDNANAEAEQITAAARDRAAAIVGDAENSLEDARTQFGIFREAMADIQRAVEAAAVSMNDQVAGVSASIHAAEERLEISIAPPADAGQDDGGEEQLASEGEESGSQGDGESFFRFTADH